jgi:hypothetical protein
MENENHNPYWTPENFCVTQIGNGAKLHLSRKATAGNRLYPMCGLDSPFSKARDTGRPLAEVTCRHCRDKATLRNLILS